METFHQFKDIYFIYNLFFSSRQYQFPLQSGTPE